MELSLYSVKKRPIRPAIILLILASFLLAACGVQLGNTNWPGLSAEDGIVYVAFGPGVVAVDVVEQTQLWSFPTEGGTVQFFAPPSVSEERVVVGDYGQPGGFLSPSLTVSVYALEKIANGVGQTPQVLWQESEAAVDKIVAPPLQVGERVFVGTGDNNVLAFDVATGALQWQYQTEHSIWAQPTYEDGILYVASMDKTLYAFEAETGDVLWRTRLPGAIPSKPTVVDGTIYVGSFDHKLYAIDAASGGEKWAAEAGDWVWGAAAVANDVVYFADIEGNVYAVDADGGRQIWTAKAAGPVQADVRVQDETVYVASVGDQESGQGQLLALNAGDGSQQWQAVTAAPIHASPVVTDDFIVVIVQQQEPLLLVYDRQTGVLRWQHTPALPQ